MERFLRYSLERQQKIRLVLTQSGRIRQLTATVTFFDGQELTLLRARPKEELHVTLGDILAADYVKGDEGI